MILMPTLGYCRTRPPHLVRKSSTGDGVEIQCTKLENYLIQDKCLRKVGGTEAYNSTALSAFGIPFILRSYHIRADGEIVKRTHCYNDGGLYTGNDLTGALSQAQITQNLSKNAIPTSFIFQVAGNSIAYLLTGKDVIRKYDGNGSFVWDEVGGDLTGITDYEAGLIHLDRAWYIRRKSSELEYSDSLDPEQIADSIVIGKDKDSFLVRCVEGSEETLYAFKNNSIYRLYGRTPAQFQFRKVTDKYGLASKRGIYPVGSGFIFLNTFDKELYFFGGSEASIKPLTEDDIRLREIMDTSDDALASVDMTVSRGFFRFAFQHLESPIDANDSELVYCINDPSAEGLPKWSLIRGSRVWCYSVWDNYGDKQELVTGRSDTGKMMYHNRGKNWENLPIVTDVRTGEVVLSEDEIVTLDEFFIKGKPTSNNKKVVFRYFMNGKYSDRGEENVSTAGETFDLGELHISMQSIFTERIIALTEHSKGNSISFGIYQNELDTDMEFYSIALKAKNRFKIRNKYN